MELKNKFTWGEAAMHYAIGQIGVHEIPIGSNWGPEIQIYLNAVGVEFPASWCMAFVYYCVVHSGMEDLTDKLILPIPLYRSPHVLTVWAKTPSKYKMEDISKAKPGDIFIMDFGNGAGHTGFVTNRTDSRILTIEGNSNLDGSREGKQVCRKTNGRRISTIKGLIRL